MKILLVVDMQYDFINGALGSEAAQAIVPNVIEKIKLRNLFVADYLRNQKECDERCQCGQAECQNLHMSPSFSYILTGMKGNMRGLLETSITGASGAA